MNSIRFYFGYIIVPKGWKIHLFYFIFGHYYHWLYARKFNYKVCLYGWSWVSWINHEGSTATAICILCSWWFILVQAFCGSLWLLCCKMDSILRFCLPFLFVGMSVFNVWCSCCFSFSDIVYEDWKLNSFSALFALFQLVYALLFFSS